MTKQACVGCFSLSMMTAPKVIGGNGFLL